MSKAVLRSIKPYWFYLICEGKKQIEVGKNVPKSKDWNRLVELYCSKDMCSFNRIPKEFQKKYRPFIGKVGARFVCDYIEADDLYQPEAWKDSCLTQAELIAYGDGQRLYGWHISDLVIYDKPKELGEFYTDCQSKGNPNDKQCKNCSHLCFDHDPINGHIRWCRVYGRKPLTRPPMSWCYVEKLR